MVDVVVVSYNSRSHLRSCLAPLAGADDVKMIVVDNASEDGSIDSVRDLPIRCVELTDNHGFAYACNVGWKHGDSPYVLFLNPDATIDRQSLHRLVNGLKGDRSIGVAAPKIVDSEGALEFSQRRFPRPVSTFSQALFLHRFFPRAWWADELIRDPEPYTTPRRVDWVSGACVLVRRDLLERLGGWDDGFFLYCEDIDLCKRAQEAGFGVLFEPSALAVHVGGTSVPRASLLPTLAASRVRYAKKHRRRPTVLLERVGLAVGALTHLFIARGGRAVRVGHARSLRAIVDAGFGGNPSGRPSKERTAKRSMLHSPPPRRQK
jgi:N-acetylglucosaminyl-diphospho-decaprenol L-rhamnosyltransferase